MAPDARAPDAPESGAGLLALTGGMQDVPLTLAHVLGRMRTVHHRSEVVTLLDADGGRARASFTQVADRADRLAAALRGLGDHLIWRGKAAGAPIVMIGHHDTVFPPGHFEGWKEEGGRAIGPGALDMKGGLAVVWGALSVLEELGVLASLPVV